MGKLSKSTGPVVYKAHVFKVFGQWLAVCQNGCLINDACGGTQSYCFRSAERHMRERHPAEHYVSNPIH
jgi:hypothetical protein